MRKTCRAPADKPIQKLMRIVMFLVVAAFFRSFFHSLVFDCFAEKKILPETTISPPGQTIVSNRTLDADTKPTWRHFVADVDVTFFAFAFELVDVVAVAGV